MTEQQLQQTIMRRVYAVFFMRKLASSLWVKAAAFAALAGASAFAVSVGNVLANMPSLADPIAVSQFYTVAFLHTEHAVQVLLFAVAILGVIVGKETVARMRHGNRPPLTVRLQP